MDNCKAANGMCVKQRQYVVLRCPVSRYQLHFIISQDISHCLKAEKCVYMVEKEAFLKKIELIRRKVEFGSYSWELEKRKRKAISFSEIKAAGRWAHCRSSNVIIEITNDHSCICLAGIENYQVRGTGDWESQELL